MRTKMMIPLAAVVIVAAALTAPRLLRRGDDGAVRVSGNIELTEVNISFKIPGKLIERTVDEGDPVKAGMVVARLDTAQLLAQQQRAQAALASAMSVEAQQRTAIEYQRATLEGQIAQRAAEVQQAEARLAALLAGSREQEKEQARAALDRAQAEYDRSLNDWKRGQALFAKDNISAADFDQYRMRYESADAQLKAAKQQLALVLEGPRREDIDQGRAQLAQARAMLRLAEAQRLELKRKEQELTGRAADVAQRRADLAVIATQLEDSVAVSPIGGTVLVKAAEPGEVLAAGTNVLTVGDLDHPWVRAYIGERDLGRVRLGDEARVTTDSFPGKSYKGRVTFIASEAEFTPKQIQTEDERSKLVYRVKIDVENLRHELKSNMPVDAEILIGRE